MPNIPVHTVPTISTRPAVYEKLSRRLDTIRQKAFERFLARGGVDGHDVEDWIAAEHEVLGWPAAELRQRDGEYEVEVALAGFGPSDVDVTVADAEIVVHATASQQSAGQDGEVVWTEFANNDVFRRFVLDEKIDRAAVDARLEDGLLRIRAPKLGQRTSRRNGRAAGKHAERTERAAPMRRT